MKFDVVKITPEMAKEMLATSKGNFRYACTSKKTVDEKIVKKYASDMKNGAWQLSPHGIVFDEDGVLVDGHHRLNAVVLAATPIDFVVCKETPQECVETIDVGLPRAYAAILTHAVEFTRSTTATKVMTLARLHFWYTKAGRSKEKLKEITGFEYKRFVEENFGDISAAINSTTRKCGTQRLANVVGCHYAAFLAIKSGVTESCLYDFFTIVNTGLYNEAGESAAILLRNMLLSPFKGTKDDYYREKVCVYTQQCLSDYIERKPRTRAYNSPKAVYFDKYINRREETV